MNKQRAHDAVCGRERVDLQPIWPQ